MLGDAIKYISHNPPALLAFAGVVAAVLVLVCLLLMLLRGRRLALRAIAITRDLLEDMRSLQEQFDELERRFEARIDSRTGDLDTRMTRKIDQKGDLIQERLEQNRSDLGESVQRLEGRVASAQEEVARFRQRIDEVEGRIPGLFDRLDEFRDTLGRTFQAELSGVLNSFDASVAGILQQMKSELQLGVSRIEGIEQMVRGRESAERTLLGSAAEVALEEEEDETSRFAEWEEEAKNLAEGEEEDEVAEAHPGEMEGAAEPEGEDALASALYDDAPDEEGDEDEDAGPPLD